jgi:hypothetical protein
MDEFTPMSHKDAEAFMGRQPRGTFTVGQSDARRYLEADMVLKGFAPAQIKAALDRL